MTLLSNTNWSGVFTALVTPFDEAGSIDWVNFESLLDLQRDAGITGLVICGTTGESTSLSVQEKLSLVRKAKAYLGDSMKIMVGTGGQNTQQSIELSKLAADAGADSVLIVTPPYIKPNISGLLGHYTALSDALSIPICLYHVPGRTNQKLDIETITRLCQIEGVTMVKEASADLELFSATTQFSKGPVFSGDDSTFLPSLAIGAAGSISVTSNLFPREYKEIHDLFISGRMQSARTLHNALFPLFQNLFIESNPAPVKYCMHRQGLISSPHLRLPLACVSKESSGILDRCMDQVEMSLSSLRLAKKTGGV